jgi:hypothetical protein
MKTAKKSALIHYQCRACGQSFPRYQSMPGVYCSRDCWRARPKTDLATRFWSKVLKTDGCWLWQAGTNEHGYGLVQVGKRSANNPVPSKAHRVAWELTYGPIPEGKNILHNCPGGDNPSCVNPAHLYAGSQRDNVTDMWAKGRAGNRSYPGWKMPAEKVRRGEASRNAKLTEDEIRQIRALYAAGSTQVGLAAQFGVSQATVSRVVLRQGWAHVC